MKFQLTHYLYIVIFLQCMSTAILSQETNEQIDYPSVCLKLTQEVPLYSKIMNEEYLLNISFPKDYNINTQKKYPVIYLLDGWAFSSGFHFIYHLLNIFGGLPELLIVGISYKADFKTWMDKRQRDMIPLKDSFIEFLTKELIHYVNSNYRTEINNRTLVGISTGGFFGFYTLFTKPDLFNNYILGGPGFIVRKTNIFNIEKEFFQNHKTLDAKVFACIGSLEQKERKNNFIEFIKILKNRDYKNFKFSSMILEDETHYTSIPTTFLKGLQYIFIE